MIITGNPPCIASIIGILCSNSFFIFKKQHPHPKNSFKIYPNPAMDLIHIQLSHVNSTAKLNGSIFNAAGQWIHRFSFTGTEHQIPTTSFPTGQYFVTLEINGKLFSKTFLVK
ncbi:MAG: T9SS type A sorting domain-containing protein [Flavobacteriaceae bacterium]|nr:T9SS type A sorting domain-containing protein [Flavobacteriaceae bacterium]